jgi:hypothetical protein
MGKVRGVVKSGLVRRIGDDRRETQLSFLKESYGLRDGIG